MRVALLFNFICVAAVAAQTPSSQLIGRVLEQGKTDGIAGATVKISSGATTVSDKRGWFTFPDVPGGRIAVSVEMIGYQSRADSITIQAGRKHDIEIRLSTKPVELPPLAVTVRSRWLEENGFYERRLSGLAPRIITAADIERRGRSTLTEVLGELPSVRVYNAPSSSPTVRKIVRFMSGDGDQNARRSRIPGCEPALFIDGMRYRDRLQPEASGLIDHWDVIAPLAIDAIEIYRGGGAPMMYNDNCGTILIWTKRGG
jgi:Carboxypeptidase regulatory-like domain/TonB-dependent Receptor Plug Domain